MYGINDSDFVQDAIGNTGVSIAWHTLTKNEQFSHATRIREHFGEILKTADAEWALARGIFPGKYGDELQAIKTLRAKLLPTRLETPEQIRTFKRENPPGTRFTAKNKDGNYSTYKVE